jgi:hypothetical protein
MVSLCRVDWRCRHHSRCQCCFNLNHHERQLLQPANFWEGAPCFIATAAYGKPMAEEIQILREFRDEYLLTNPLGRALVGLYYKVSPSIAGFITEHPILKTIVMVGLLPAVAMSRVVVNTTQAEKILIICLVVMVSAVLAILAIRQRGIDSSYVRE